MSSQALLVQLPRPCAENWDAMTPVAAGRHCAACQHEVVDFTAFTDGELAAYLARPGKVPCGRFRQSQLDRPLYPAAAPVSGWQRWWGAVAAVLGLGALATPAQAQATQGQPATAQQPGKPAAAGQPAQPATTRATCASPAQTGAPMLLGEPALAGAPIAIPVKAVPVKMGKPAPIKQKK